MKRNQALVMVIFLAWLIGFGVAGLLSATGLSYLSGGAGLLATCLAALVGGGLVRKIAP